MTAVRPLRRTDGVTSSKVDDVLLVLNTGDNVVYSLTAAAATIWPMCDGRRDANGLATASGLGVAAVTEALAQLDAAGLLLETGPSRRRVLQFGALGGGALVTMLALPAAAAAASLPVSEHLDVDYFSPPSGGASVSYSAGSRSTMGPPNYALAQPFTVGHDGKLTSVKVRVLNISGSDPLLVQIRAASLVDGAPAATPLATAVVEQTTIRANNTVSTSIGPLPVTTGDRLFVSLLITPPTTTTSDGWYINPDRSGVTYESTNSGAGWTKSPVGKFELQTYLTY